jgi:hypothetical protein
VVNGFVNLLFRQNTVLQLNLLSLRLRALQMLLHINNFLQLQEGRSQSLYVFFANKYGLLAQRRKAHDGFNMLQLKRQQPLRHFVISK